MAKAASGIVKTESIELKGSQLLQLAMAVPESHSADQIVFPVNSSSRIVSMDMVDSR